MNKILVLLSVLFFSVSASAFEISTGTTFNGSTTVTANSYTVSGTVVKNQTDHRHIDQTDVLGQRSVGIFRERSTQTTYINQYGSGAGVSVSGSVGGNSSIGGLSTGYQLASGGGVMASESHDRSVITEQGRSVANVDISVGGSHVGSAREVVTTNTVASLNNNDYTTSVSGWTKFTAYAE